MKRIIFVLLLLGLTASPTIISACENQNSSITAKQVEYVYLCDSNTAKVYHSSQHCKGLSHCTHEIIKVTLDDAINKYGRRACKICE